jgi:hypothetical protein
MVKDLLRRNTISFVVRVWAEYQGQIPASCYGEIECLDNGEKYHFRHWQEIATFIERQTSEALANESGVMK